jgi:hypothetical protein
MTSLPRPQVAITSTSRLGSLRSTPQHKPTAGGIFYRRTLTMVPQHTHLTSINMSSIDYLTKHRLCQLLFDRRYILWTHLRSSSLQQNLTFDLPQPSLAFKHYFTVSSSAATAMMLGSNGINPCMAMINKPDTSPD